MPGRRCWGSPTCAAGDTSTRLAAGFGVGVATGYRYVREAVDLLAALAADPAAVTNTAAKAYVVRDGTLLAIDRVGMATGADRPYYSGKHSATGWTCMASPTRPGGCSGPHPPSPVPPTT